MNVVLHAAAAADVGATGDWYEAQRPGLGIDFAYEVDRALELIGERHEAWPLWPDTPPDLAVRRFVLPRFPFAIAFMAFDDRVVVLAVAHERRRPGFWLGRLT